MTGTPVGSRTEFGVAFKLLASITIIQLTWLIIPCFPLGKFGLPGFGTLHYNTCAQVKKVTSVLTPTYSDIYSDYSGAITQYSPYNTPPALLFMLRILESPQVHLTLIVLRIKCGTLNE